MCERCVAAQAALEKHHDRIEQLIEDAKKCLEGNYSQDVREMIAHEPFPADQPFQEKLYQIASAIGMLASAQAIIQGDLPSEIHMEHLQIARQVEIANGLLPAGIRAVAIPVGAEGIMGALEELFGVPRSASHDDKPEHFH